MAASSERLFCLIVVAAFLPPLAVGIEFGCTGQLCLNIVLSIIPLAGFIHAVYLLVNNRGPKADEEHGNGPSYAFPQHGQPQGQAPQGTQGAPQEQLQAAPQEKYYPPQQQHQGAPEGQPHEQPHQQVPQKYEESGDQFQPPSYPPEGYSKMQQQ